MPPAYETIKTLSAGKNDRGIILRLIRKYDLPDYYGGKRPLSLECIFHDIEGEDLQNVPPEIDGALANKKALFKVNVVHEERASEKVFSVLKLESDMAVITNVCGSGNHVGATEPLIPMVDHAAESVEMVGSSSTAFSTPNQKGSSEGNTTEPIDGDMLSKRLIDEFSSSIKAKKKMKRLKQEK